MVPFVELWYGNRQWGEIYSYIDPLFIKCMEIFYMTVPCCFRIVFWRRECVMDIFEEQMEELEDKYLLYLLLRIVMWWIKKKEIMSTGGTFNLLYLQTLLKKGGQPSWIMWGRGKEELGNKMLDSEGKEQREQQKHGDQTCPQNYLFLVEFV